MNTGKPSSPVRAREWVPAAIIAGVLIVSAAVDVPACLPRSPCVFRNVTGLPCPGCGMTRGFTAMSRGRFSDAARANPLSPLAYVLAVGYLALFGVRRLAPDFGPRIRATARVRWGLFAVVFAAVLASWSVTFLRHLAGTSAT